MTFDILEAAIQSRGIAMTVTLAKWTIDDYHHMIATGLLAGRPVELLNGEIVEMSPEGEPHSSASTVARDYLIRLLGDRAIVREGHPMTIPSSNSEPEPDLAIVRMDEADYWQQHPQPADIYWLIEFANTSLSKDVESKAKVYVVASIPEYWVGNLKTMQLIVMREPVGGEYRFTTTYSEGSICPLAFPDLTIEVTRLFRRR